MNDFNNKTVAITGAASGIGRQAALVFAQRGANVAISDVNEKGGQETLKMLLDIGVKASFTLVNVVKEEEVAAWTAQIVQDFGGLHAAVNNAGIDGVYHPTEDYPSETFDQVIQINVHGVWYGMKHQLKHMRAQGQGCVVNIASLAGFMALPRASAYVASKHAVIGMTKTAAAEYGRYGIRVNAVCPAFTETPMVTDSVTAANSKLDLEAMAKMNPSKRIAQAVEIANGIVYLCSEQSTYINGQKLVIDGGLSIV